jgi:hypothetical protein
LPALKLRLFKVFSPCFQGGIAHITAHQIIVAESGALLFQTLMPSEEGTGFLSFTTHLFAPGQWLAAEEQTLPTMPSLAQ